MIPVTQLRAGAVFEKDGQLWQVIKYEHQKIGRGSANIKLRVKNIRTGAVSDLTFISGSKVEPVDLIRKQAQFLYREDDFFNFMDPKTYEQTQLEKSFLGDQGMFLKEGEVYGLTFWEDKPLAVELPVSLVLEIKKTGPGVKGDSATNIFKEAVCENDLVVKVPLFIKEGDRVKVDTRTGEYVERVKAKSPAVKN
ncbi:MAG: elongation factor P [Candidatus Pacebacteria bacterium]|nr:elongation factor P [Candidatus Paceibacterota bacterium]